MFMYKICFVYLMYEYIEDIFYLMLVICRCWDRSALVSGVVASDAVVGVQTKALIERFD